MHPRLKLVATASSDATIRIYKNRKLKNQQQFFHKFTIKSREDQNEQKTSTTPATEKTDQENDEMVDLSLVKENDDQI